MKNPNRKTRQLAVYNELLNEITDGEKGNNRMPSVKELTERFGVSRFTVQNVMNRLEEEGYIERIHGLGTFIHERISPLAMNEVVSVCLKYLNHLNDELCAELIERLQNRRKVVSLINPEYIDLLKKLSFTPSKYFFIYGSNSFDFSVFNMRSFQSKTIIGLLQWPNADSDIPRVVCDWQDSAAQRIKHLQKLGHERALYIVPGGQKWYIKKHPFSAKDTQHGSWHDYSFVREWQKLGHQIELVESKATPESVQIDPKELIDLFDQLQPTTIVGSRDVDTLEAYKILVSEYPHLENKLCLMGFYNTPWSHAVPGGMTTMNLNLDQIAEKAVGIMDTLESGRDLQETVISVKPTLVVRESSKLVF